MLFLYTKPSKFSLSPRVNTKVLTMASKEPKCQLHSRPHVSWLLLKLTDHTPAQGFASAVPSACNSPLIFTRPFPCHSGLNSTITSPGPPFPSPVIIIFIPGPGYFPFKHISQDAMLLPRHLPVSPVGKGLLFSRYRKHQR